MHRRCGYALCLSVLSLCALGGPASAPAVAHTTSLSAAVADPAVVTLTVVTPAGRPVSSVTTHESLVFRGSVDTLTSASGDDVAIQERVATAPGGWRTIASGKVGPTSGFQVNYRFDEPVQHRVRAYVVLPTGAATSRTLEIQVRQRQTSLLTIGTGGRSHYLGAGGSVVIVGKATPGLSPRAPITLWSREFGTGFAAGPSEPLSRQRTYRFVVWPTQNTEYVIRAGGSATTQSARLVIDVQDAVSIAEAPPVPAFGQSVAFTGSVSPAKPGESVELQRDDGDGNYVTVATTKLSAASTYDVQWVVDLPGPSRFRVRVPGDRRNVGSASASVRISAKGTDRRPR